MLPRGRVLGVNECVSQGLSSQKRHPAELDNVHQLIYKEDNGATIANVTEATDNLKVASDDLKTTTADVKEIVAEVKRGEGTLGALIKDPSVYEDVKTLLGNVKRNDAVKALVRYAIEREDQIASPQPVSKGK